MKITSRFFGISVERVDGQQRYPIEIVNHGVPPANEEIESTKSGSLVHLFRFWHTSSENPETAIYVIGKLNRPGSGTYHVEVDLLESNPELKGIDSELVIGRYISGK